MESESGEPVLKFNQFLKTVQIKLTLVYGHIRLCKGRDGRLLYFRANSQTNER